MFFSDDKVIALQFDTDVFGISHITVTGTQEPQRGSPVVE